MDKRIVVSRAALRAALIALVGEQPLEQISIAAITQRADIGYATFFRHYSGRDALLEDIADGLIGELTVAVAPVMRAGGPATAAQMLTHFVAERHALCRALLVGAGEAMRREITMRGIAVADAAAIPLPDWLPRRLGVAHLVAATLNVLRWWLEEEEDQSADAIAQIIDRLVFAPAMTRSGENR